MFAVGSKRGACLRVVLGGLSALLALVFLVVPARQIYAAPPQIQWQSYTNTILGYSISYPATWHRLQADPRLAQEFINYNERTAPMSFPAHGSYTKVEVYLFEKPATQDLESWMKEKVNRPDLPGPDRYTPPDKTVRQQIAGFPAIQQTWDSQAVRSTSEYLDAGSGVFIINLLVSDLGDLATAQRVASSFHITGKLDPARATLAAGSGPTPPPTICCPGGWDGLTLPMQVDYAGNNMPTLAMNGGGVNSWFDHNTPTGTNGSLTRYDGQVLSNSGGCSTGWSCYDGHGGIDFNTNGMTGIPVYASDWGTVTTQDQGSTAAVSASSYRAAARPISRHKTATSAGM